MPPKHVAYWMAGNLCGCVVTHGLYESWVMFFVTAIICAIGMSLWDAWYESTEAARTKGK